MNTQTHIGAGTGIHAPHKEISVGAKKYLVIVAVVLLLAFGVLMLLGSNKNNKTDLAGGGGIPPVGENVGILPIADDSDSNSASEPEEEVIPPVTDGGGSIFSDAGVPDDMVEVEVDYTKLLYRYAEMDSFGNQILWGDVDGHLLYSRVLEYKQGENLVVSIGYLDNKNIWNEFKRFVTTDAYKSKSGLPEKDDYNGSFIKTDDLSYDGGKVIFGIYINPIRLNPKGYAYRNRDDGQMYRPYDVTTDPPIVYTGE